jgi:hypothetical protein
MSQADDVLSGKGTDEGTSAKAGAGPWSGYDGFAGSTLHSGINRAFITFPASLSVGEALSIIAGRRDGEVVIIRRRVGDLFHFYLRSCYDLRHSFQDKNPEDSVEAILDLHEHTSTNTIPRKVAEKGLQDDTIPRQPTVVIEGGKAIGYFGFTVYLAAPVAAPGGPSRMDEEAGSSRGLSAGYDFIGPRSIFKTKTRRGMAEEEIDGTSEDGDAIEAAPAVPPVPQPEPPLPCHFAAQMPEEAVLGAIQQVQTTISREEIAIATGRTAQQGKALIAPSPEQKITVRVIPKRNFEVIGDSRVDIKAPEPGEPAIELFFDVKATSPGEGELWIAFCQGPVSLITLKLKPQIVTEQTAGIGAPIEAAAVVTPPVDEPVRLNVMHVDLMENGDKIRYRYWLLLDSANIDQEYESPEFNDDIMTVLKPYMGLFDEVEASTAADFDQLQIQLRSIGARLFQTLFPKDLQSVFWEHRDQITHLKFYCEEPYIPWEILHVCEPGKPLRAETRFLGQMGLVRWLPGHNAPRKLRIRPGRARYITPSYPGKELKSAQQEGGLLESLFDATPVTPATRPEVTKLFAQKGPFDLFHFAGHGQASEGQITDSKIELEPASPDSSRQLRDLTPDIIAGLCDLKAEDGTQAIVVLNSCRAGKIGRYVTGLSGFAPAFLEREAGLFVGALWMIGDEPAVTFIEAFYKALRDGKCVADAVVTGREKARNEGDATYLAYVVYGDPLARLVQ